MLTRNRGFTLTEALTVLAIIVLLSSLVFALTAPMRERARQSRCMSNLRQIGLALQTYRQDSDAMDPLQGGLPLPSHRLGLPDGLWTQRLQLPRTVWFCPSRWCDPYYSSTRERYASSYMFLALSDREVDALNQDSDTHERYRPTGEILADDPNFPIIVCVYHDRYRHRTGEERSEFHRKGRVLGLTLFGDVRWYNYAELKQLRYYR